MNGHGVWTGRGRLRSAVAAMLAVLALGGAGAVVTPVAAQATGMVWQVTNYDNDGTHGVYLRRSPNLSDVSKVSSNYLLYGTNVQLLCWQWGTAVGSYANRVWHDVKVLSGANTGHTGWLSDHWVNDPASANHPLAGEPQCGSAPAPTVTAAETKAVNWAKGYVNVSSMYHNMCLSFVRNAYASAGVDLRSRVGVYWGSSTYPADIWGHFTAGRTGTSQPPPTGALVFYLPNAGYSKAYSHVTISVGDGREISTSDAVDGTWIHYETISQHDSRAYSHYVGWWLPA